MVSFARYNASGSLEYAYFSGVLCGCYRQLMLKDWVVGPIYLLVQQRIWFVLYVRLNNKLVNEYLMLKSK